MIISDKYKYLFIEVPHTGSSALSKELREKYDGQEILYKHANYHEFLKVATPQQKKYFVFAGVRNPLEEVVSDYNKYLTNNDNSYTDPKLLIKNGGWVSERKVELYKMVQANKDFGQFLRASHKTVFTSNANVNKKHCDYILKLETIDDDLTNILKELGVKKARPLPVVNKTKRKGTYKDYYKGDSINYAVKIFGPFMEEWGYELPKEWSGAKVKPYDRMLYKLAKLGRSGYSTLIKGGPLKGLTFIRDKLE